MIERGVMHLFPSHQAWALRKACDIDKPADRLAEIDRITDQLVEMGKCRLRSDVSREAEWKAASLRGVWR